MYIFMETTVLLDNEFFKVIFDGDLAKLQSEVGHTGVTCSHSNNTRISVSGSWEDVQRAFCTLLIQSKTINMSTATVHATTQNDPKYMSEIPRVVESRNDKQVEQSKGLSATGTYACRTCGLAFTTKYFLKKHTCMVASQSTYHSNSSRETVSVEPDLDPVVIACTAAESESEQETIVMPCDLEHNYHTRTKERVLKTADGIITLEKLQDIMKNLCPNDHGMFVCTICSHSGNNKVQFREHMLRHHVERVWRCAICGTLCGLKKDLTKHNISCHSTNGGVHCCICMEKYPTFKSFRIHMRLDHKIWKPPKCSTGQRQFNMDVEKDMSTTSEINNLKHPENNTNDNNTSDSTCMLENAKISTPSSSCDTDLCSYYITEDELNELISNQAGSSQFSCSICHYIAYTELTFREHMMRRHMERKWKCDICDKCFGPKRDLRRHKRFLHDAPVEVFCIVCRKRYPSKGSLERHMAIHRRKWKCDTCSKCYVRKEDLETHQLIHVDKSIEALHTCRICNHTSHTKYSMYTHMALHQLNGEFLNEQENSKPFFKCSICSKNFTNPHNLNAHEAAHLQIRTRKGKALRKPLSCKAPPKPFSCSDCNKGFLSKHALKAHKETHNAKTVKCPLCPKTFLNKYRLIDSHMPFHSVKRDYICSICGKTFHLKSTLTAHEKLHSDIKPYGCPHCKLTYKIHYECKRHMVVRHGYHKQDYDLIHQRMLFNPQGLFPKDVNLDPDTTRASQSNSENPATCMVVDDDDGRENLLTLFETGASDAQHDTGHIEMTYVDETNIMHTDYGYIV